MSFISFAEEITELVQHIVAVPSLHGLWLNTLSYLENCGARKIASCEHPTAVKEEMLKHAAEEFRHAFYLKTQLARIEQSYEDYRRSHLLGGWAAHNYLNALDVQTSRYLRKLGMTLPETKQLAYLLVTYAIELRAGELYPIYQAALRKISSKVQVQSILLEEKEHLREMEEELSKIPSSPTHIKAICQLEADACKQWLKACYSETLFWKLPFVDSMFYGVKSHHRTSGNEDRNRLSQTHLPFGDPTLTPPHRPKYALVEQTPDLSPFLSHESGPESRYKNQKQSENTSRTK